MATVNAADTRLVTTPCLLKAFVVRGGLSETTAIAILEDVAQHRRWDGNADVHQATRLFD